MAKLVVNGMAKMLRSERPAFRVLPTCPSNCREGVKELQRSRRRLSIKPACGSSTRYRPRTVSGKQTAMPKAGDKQEPKTIVDAETLQAEVRAFASSLGFPTAAAAGSFEYDDFAPQKAAKKLTAQPGAQQHTKQPGSNEGRSKGQQQQQQQRQQQADKQLQSGKQQQKQRGDQQQQGHKGKQQQQQQQQEGLTKEQQQQAAKEEAIRTRTWVDSVGPRPGVCRAWTCAVAWLRVFVSACLQVCVCEAQGASVAASRCLVLSRPQNRRLCTQDCSMSLPSSEREAEE
jgi:hypothetical protein